MAATATAAMSPQQVKQEISRGWWLWLVWGFAAIVLGILLLVRPVQTALEMTIFIGIWWIVQGVIDVVQAIARRQGPWGWFLFTGIISILAGAFLVSRPVLGLLVAVQLLYYLIAFMLVFVGLTRIFAGYRNASGIGYTWTWGSLIIGIIMVVGGVMLLLTPDIVSNFVTVTTVGALLAITSGVAAVLFAFRVRSLKNA